MNSIDFNIKDVPDPELFLDPGPSSNFSANMDRIFADDDIKTGNFVAKNEHKKEETPEGSVKPDVFRKGITFWNGRAVIFLLTGEKSPETKVHLVLINKQDKRILERVCVDEVDFTFREPELAVSLTRKGENIVEPIRLAFVDRNEYISFCLTILIRSNCQEAFIVSEGFGERQIDEDTVILYSLTVHRADDDGLAIPKTSDKLKRKMDVEKLNNHKLYKWLKGLRRGCQVFIKTSEGVVNELVVLKDKKHSTTSSEAADEQNVLDTEINEEDTPIDVEDEVVRESSTAELTSSVPVPATRVFLPQTTTSDSTVIHSVSIPSTSSEDIRDALHRIVGIELDRIEMRLNSKFEQFQISINSRLDQQTLLLQQILDSTKKNECI